MLILSGAKGIRPGGEFDAWVNSHPQITQITRNSFQIIAAKAFRLKAKVSGWTNGKMDKESDKREFERLPIDSIMKVCSEDVEGRKCEDKAVLKDVSGEGARFLTQESALYFPGQVLELTVFLPGTDEMEAHMKARAIVIRIDPSDDTDKDKHSRGLSIAVKFETRLNFERISV